MWLRPLQGTTQRGPPTTYLKRSPERVGTAFPGEVGFAFPREGPRYLPRRSRPCFPPKGSTLPSPVRLALLSPEGVHTAFPEGSALLTPMRSALLSPEGVHTAFPDEVGLAFPRKGPHCLPRKGFALPSPVRSVLHSLERVCSAFLDEVGFAFPRKGPLYLPRGVRSASPKRVRTAFPRRGRHCVPQRGPQRSVSATLVEFLLPSTLEPRRVHSSPAYLTGYVPSSGFLTHTTVCSSPERPALFHAGNAHGISLSRGFPSLLGPATLRHGITLLAFLLRFQRNNLHFLRGARSSRLLWNPPTSLWPPSGPCSSSESVPPVGLLRPVRAVDPLLSFRSLSRVLPIACRPRHALRVHSCAFLVPALHDRQHKCYWPHTENLSEARSSGFTHQRGIPHKCGISPPEVLWPSTSGHRREATYPVHHWPNDALRSWAHVSALP
jgi:hypothetical protein